MSSDAFWAGHPSAWDRDPSVVDPSIMNPLDGFHHFPTGAMVACYSVRGQWSDAALDEMRRSFAAALPGRHHAQVLSVGVARFAVCLGTDRSLFRLRIDVPEYLIDIDIALRCSARAFDRGVAVLTGRRSDPSLADLPTLPEPPGPVLEAFRRAGAALGDAIQPPDIHPDSAPRGDWGVLRKSTGLRLRDRLYSWSPR